MKIVTFTRPGTKNIGDLTAPWFNFFPEPSDTYHVRNGKMPAPGEYDVAVFGGGLYPKTQRIGQWIHKNKELGAKGTIMVGWGVGSNWGKLDDSNFELFSQRENFDNWAPCPSCMMSLLDRYRTKNPDYQAVFYQNDGLESLTSMTNKKLGPILGNHHDSLEEIIKFLASGKVVVTSSFHGMFWATMLGRKVGVVPIRKKLRDAKWVPVYIRDPGNWHRVVNEGKAYPGALDEARSKTLEFYKKFKSILERKTCN